MKGSVACLLAAAFLNLALWSSAAAQAPAVNSNVKVDSETISGLGARNIGSAAMSGRVAAIDAAQEGTRLTVYIGSASGGVWKSVNGARPSSRSSTNSLSNPSARLRLIQRIRR